jgi:hypothetical protein
VTLVFALLLLTACGDVSGNGINFDSNIEYWPGNADFYAEKTFSDQVVVEDHISFRLDAVNGRIDITGEPGSDKVIVTAELRVGSDSYEDALDGLNRLDVRITVSNDEIFIQTLQPENTQGRHYVVDYTITLPSDVAVETNHVNGNLIVGDIENSVSADMVNGNADLSHIFGDASVSVGNGRIDATITLPLNGVIRLSSVNGDLDLRIPKTTSAELSALVDNGAITWGQLELTDTLTTNHSLSGTLGDGAGVIDLDTTNGDIRITGFDG